MPRKKKQEDHFGNIWEGLGELMGMVDNASPGAGADLHKVVDHLVGDRRDSHLADDEEYKRRRAADRARFAKGYRKEKGK